MIHGDKSPGMQVMHELSICKIFQNKNFQQILLTRNVSNGLHNQTVKVF